jgi:hypothetical protein
MLACAAMLWIAASVEAQEAVWLVPVAQQRASWCAPLGAGLVAEGVIVREAAADAPACDPACSVENARELGLRVAVRVRAVQRRDGELESAVLTLETVDGRAGEASIDLEARDRVASVRAAYRSAELALELGELGLLRVHSSPEGALVTIDGEAAGLAPLDRKLRARTHEVVFALSGFSSERRRQRVTRGQTTELTLQLKRIVVAAPAGTSTASPLNFILGGVLVAAAAPALVFSIATLASDGDCHKHDAIGGCVEQVHFGTRSGLLLGLGSAALLGAASLFIVQPFTVEAHAEPRGARLAIGTRF